MDKTVTTTELLDVIVKFLEKYKNKKKRYNQEIKENNKKKVIYDKYYNLNTLNKSLLGIQQKHTKLNVDTLKQKGGQVDDRLIDIIMQDTELMLTQVQNYRKLSKKTEEIVNSNKKLDQEISVLESENDIMYKVLKKLGYDVSQPTTQTDKEYIASNIDKVKLQQLLDGQKDVTIEDILVSSTTSTTTTRPTPPEQQPGQTQSDKDQSERARQQKLKELLEKQARLEMEEDMRRKQEREKEELDAKLKEQDELASEEDERMLQQLQAIRDAEEKAMIQAQEKTDLEAKRQQEAEVARKQAEEQRRQRRQQEEQARQLETKRRADEEARKKAELEAKKQAEEQRRQQAELETKRRADEEARKQAEEQRRQQEAEVARKQAEEQRRQQEEQARQLEIKRLEEAEQARKQAELVAKQEAKRQADEEAKKREEEQRRQQEADVARKQAEEQRRQQEAEVARKQAELDAKREAKRREEELKAKKQAELEARRQAELEAKRRTDEEAKKQAELEASRQAEKQAEETHRKRIERERLAQETREKTRIEREARENAELERITKEQRRQDEIKRLQEEEALAIALADREKKDKEARKEAEQKAKLAREEQARKEAEQKAREEQVRKEAEQKAREEQAKREAEQKAKLARDEQAIIQAQLETKRKEDELKAQQEQTRQAEQKAKEQAEDKAKLQAPKDNLVSQLIRSSIDEDFKTVQDMMRSEYISDTQIKTLELLSKKYGFRTVTSNHVEQQMRYIRAEINMFKEINSIGCNTRSPFTITSDIFSAASDAVVLHGVMTDKLTNEQKDFALKAFCRAHDENEYYRLVFESNIGKIISKYTLMFTPNIIKIYGNIQCTKEPKISMQKYFGIQDETKQEVKLTELGCNARLDFTINIMEFIQGKSLYNVMMDPYHAAHNYMKQIVFMILLNIRLLARLGFRHNDLHTPNIQIIDLEEEIVYKYTVDNKDYYIKTRFLPIIYDFDRSAKVTEPKMINTYLNQESLCTLFGQCNSNNDIYDMILFLCTFNTDNQALMRKVFDDHSKIMQFINSIKEKKAPGGVDRYRCYNFYYGQDIKDIKTYKEDMKMITIILDYLKFTDPIDIGNTIAYRFPTDSEAKEINDSIARDLKLQSGQDLSPTITPPPQEIKLQEEKKAIQASLPSATPAQEIKLQEEKKQQQTGDLMGHIEIYEHPIQNAELFKLRVDSKTVAIDKLDEKFVSITGISRNKEYISQGKIRKDSSCNNQFVSGNGKYSTKYQSCDPIVVNYIYHDSGLDNYLTKFDSASRERKERVQIIKELLQDTLLVISLINKPVLLEWFAQCLDLPELAYALQCDDVKCKKYAHVKPASLTQKEFDDAKGGFIITVKEDFNKLKLGSDILNKIEKSFGDLGNKRETFTYAMKMNLEANAQICIFGDFHSSIHTLIRSLTRLAVLGYIDENMKFTKNAGNFYMFFLGDTVDRGLYGPEVFYTIALLKINNPDRVYLIRGNHEDWIISASYGFLYELTCKIYNNCGNEELFTEFSKTWLYLPSAIFLKIAGQEGYIQLCHGGLYRNPHKIAQFLKSDKEKVLEIPITSDSDDFKWSDFMCGKGVMKESEENWGQASSRGNGRVYNAETAVEYMKIAGISAVIRGHQDMIDNTKLISKDHDCLSPIEWELFVNGKERDKFTKYMPTEQDTFAVRFPIPNSQGLEKYSNEFYPPVYTFTTAVSPRLIDSDGYGIITFGTNKSTQSGGSIVKRYKLIRISK